MNKDTKCDKQSSWLHRLVGLRFLTAQQWANIVAGMRHDGQLVRELRREVESLERYKRRMEWLHDCSTGCTDAEGFEWGIYRVKWENGHPVRVWQTNSDFSDLDAEMARELSSLPNVKIRDGEDGAPLSL